VSPLTLLNDHSIVGKDRDLFKGLKGDKQILRHYNQVDRIIADIQLLQNTRLDHHSTLEEEGGEVSVE
jgi:hypothetical protein